MYAENASRIFSFLFETCHRYMLPNCILIVCNKRVELKTTPKKAALPSRQLSD